MAAPLDFRSTRIVLTSTFLNDMNKALLVLLMTALALGSHQGIAQSIQNFKWFYDTSLNKEGQYWSKEVAASFDRLPSRAKDLVPARVWELSRYPAGEIIRFTTTAKRIVVQYAVSQNLSMPHMPTTGVSGVDLYAINKNGKEFWVPGRFSFKDTIEYVFNNIAPIAGDLVFQLYLPLYNQPKWMRIGVSEKDEFRVLAERKAPIVIYGTSIVQGGCASRPGMAWPAILGRKLNLPVVNLGFSGSGKMEAPVINLVNEIDARVFILDCMPNLTRVYKLDSLIYDRYLYAVRQIRSKHPRVPVVLAEHSGGIADGYLDLIRSEDYRLSSVLLDSIYQKLKKEGFDNIFQMTSKQFDFSLESTVDGLHPNDIGMVQYAEAYEKLLKKIIK
jgi:lysophospholipase L1-like esterase